MESLAIGVSAIGHSCWDYQLTWMVSKDPDASIIHMHWLRMLFMAVCLQPLSWKETRPQESTMWWVKFAFVGWIIPSLMYTLSVLWSDYRIIVSLQSFIPLLIVLRQAGVQISERKAGALILTMVGTLCLWLSVSWTLELWKLWASVIASVFQVVSLSEFFVMLNGCKGSKLGAITTGLTCGVVIMFFATIIWTPQHLTAIVTNKVDTWVLILVASALSSVIKYGLIAYFSEKMSADGVAIFECVHPIATLVSDIIRGADIFEVRDAAAITLFTIGWIIYPKK